MSFLQQQQRQQQQQQMLLTLTYLVHVTLFVTLDCKQEFLHHLS